MKEVDFAVGPFGIERGNRDLIADPSAIIIEEEPMILSSGKLIESHEIMGISSLTNPFEYIVWILFLFTFFIIFIIRAFIDFIFTQNSDKNISFFQQLSISLYYYYANLFRQSKKFDKSLLES